MEFDRNANGTSLAEQPVEPLITVEERVTGSGSLIDIVVSVTPDNYDWQNTQLGQMRIDPIEEREGERVVRLHYTSIKLGRKNERTFVSSHGSSREVILDESGVGQQQLPRIPISDGSNVTRPHRMLFVELRSP